MRGKSKKQWPEYIGITAAAMVLAFLLSTEGIAAEDTAAIPVATSGDAMAVSVASPATAESRSRVSPERKSKGKDENILSVELPVVAEGESSPFDFFLDPCSLIYETDAMRYGGGTVEEGATLLFRNREGEYAFSSCSDKLEVISGDGEPVMVTVSASVSDMEGISLVGQEDLSEYEDPCIYLALTDGHGNVQPIFQDTKATICMELDSEAYSFGLTGACNEGADWKDISVCPKVRVTWHVEPALIEDEDEEEAEMDEDILLEDDVTGQENARKDSCETPVDDTASLDREADGITKPEAFDGGSESSGPPVGKNGAQDLAPSAGKDGVHGQDGSGAGEGYQASSEEISGNVSGQNSSDNFRKGTNSSEGTGESTPEIPESGEKSENPSEAVGEDECMDATGQNDSKEAASGADQTEKRIQDNTEQN